MPKSCWCVGAVPQNNTVSRGDFRAQSHSRLNDGISSTRNIWVLPWTRFIYVLNAVSSYNNKCENHFSHSSVRLSSLCEKSSLFPCFAYSTSKCYDMQVCPLWCHKEQRSENPPKYLTYILMIILFALTLFGHFSFFFNSNKVFYLALFCEKSTHIWYT